ncbi:Mu transposase domain-containing protein [Dactylosporangium sp. McL0621]|uniref:Mu transposase domain-containing protein n=1 Tax=Dactylosporangium sp. McL0621 TaxID=3415678 RepID=UPI003CE8A1A5
MGRRRRRPARIGTRVHTVGEQFAIERPLLPEELFETGTWLTPRVDRFSQVTVRTNRYSVPVHLVGRQVRVHLHASDLVIYDGRVEAARHERLMAKSSARLDLNHYREALLRKPGALPGSTALEQARAAGKFTPVREELSGAAALVHHGRRWNSRCSPITSRSSCMTWPPVRCLPTTGPPTTPIR